MNSVEVKYEVQNPCSQKISEETSGNVVAEATAGFQTTPLTTIIITRECYINISVDVMFLKIGHRGARAYKPENTIASFAYAIKLGVNAIEFDVRKTKDDEIVVIHDADVDRVSNGKGLVSELMLQQLKQLDLNGEKIPTLREALKFIDKKVDKILVELKEVGYEEKVLREVKKQKLMDRVIIVSFHEEALRNVRKLDKNIELGLIYVRHKHPIKTALELGVSYLLPLYRFTHTTNIQKAHANGLKVIVWTINKSEEAREYVKKGVDGIASDKPDIFKQIKI